MSAWEEIPQRAGQPSAATAADLSPAAVGWSEPAGKPLKILLVEDSLEDAELIAGALTRADLAFSLRQVQDERSFRAALDDQPDIVIADDQLPRLGGEQALGIVRARDPDLPFLMVSRAIGEDLAVAMVRLGASEYLPKDRLAGLGDAVVRARRRQLRRREDQAREAALRESESRFRRLAENAPDLVFRYRPDPGGFEYLSPAASALTGYAPEDFYADPGLAIRLAHPRDREAQAEAFRAGTGGRPATLQWIDRDGGVVWIEQRNVGVDPVGGAPSAVEGVIRDVSERKNAEEATAALLQNLRAIEARRRGLLGRLVAAQEEEGRRIAADIHDDSIQIMASAGMRLGLLARKLSDPAEVQEMRQLQDVVAQAISRLRHLMVDLRPVHPDGGGLATLLEEYLAFHRKDPGGAFDLSCHLAEELPPEIQIIVFRIAQEALTNVRKHARASEVQIRVEGIDDGVRLRVNDDGVGIPAGVKDSPLGHMGLTAMRERAETAGGWFRVGSRPGGGTTVEAWVPIEPFKLEP